AEPITDSTVRRRIPCPKSPIIGKDGIDILRCCETGTSIRVPTIIIFKGHVGGLDSFILNPVGKQNISLTFSGSPEFIRGIPSVKFDINPWDDIFLPLIGGPPIFARVKVEPVPVGSPGIRDFPPVPP